MKYIITILVLFYSVIGNCQCYKSGDYMPNTGLFISETKSVDLNNFVYSEVAKIQKQWGIKIDFYFILEDYNSNAYYTPYCNNNCNGTIALGIKLL